MKTCRLCKQTKTLDSFSPHKGIKADGRHPYCKRCRSKQNGPQARAWCKNNRERKNEMQRDAYWAKKDLVKP